MTGYWVSTKGVIVLAHRIGHECSLVAIFNARYRQKYGGWNRYEKPLAYLANYSITTNHWSTGPFLKKPCWSFLSASLVFYSYTTPPNFGHKKAHISRSSLKPMKSHEREGQKEISNPRCSRRIFRCKHWNAARLYSFDLPSLRKKCWSQEPMAYVGCILDSRKLWKNVTVAPR